MATRTSSTQTPATAQAGSGETVPRPGMPEVWRVALLAIATLGVTTFTLALGGNGGFAASSAGAQEQPGDSPGGPFAKYSVEWEAKTISLAKGTYIVAMISDSCEHCGEIVAALNQLAETPGLPPVVGLVLGEDNTLRRFRDAYGPRFPTALIPVLEFFNLIGDHPPRFYVIEGGKTTKHWDAEVPPDGTIIAQALTK